MERNLHNSCVADLDEMVKDDYVIGFKLLNSDYSKLRILKNDVSDYDSGKISFGFLDVIVYFIQNC